MLPELLGAEIEADAVLRDQVLAILTAQRQPDVLELDTAKAFDAYSFTFVVFRVGNQFDHRHVSDVAGAFCLGPVARVTTAGTRRKQKQTNHVSSAWG